MNHCLQRLAGVSKFNQRHSKTLQPRSRAEDFPMQAKCLAAVKTSARFNCFQNLSGSVSVLLTSEILCLLAQSTRLVHQLCERHLPQEDQAACSTDQGRRVIMEPFVTQALLEHV